MVASTGHTEVAGEDVHMEIAVEADHKEYVVDLLNVQIGEWEVLCLL